ncbi:MAG: retroviral-like aspartic protease [Candidatus Omnitrophica bacterium]|nr:retroviral-like aspartic protease [Candidatus Omnitrophota bacterium]
MGIIKKELMVAGSKSGRECDVLFDTGASACFVREDVASELGQVVKAPFPLAFKLGNNTVLRAEKTIDLFVGLKGHNLSFYFLVVSELPYEVIVGADFLQKWKIKLDLVTEDFIIDEKALEIILV